MIILGISGLYHDSAVALLVDGIIVAAVQEERFTRVKNDASFPVHAIQWCLDYLKLQLKDVDLVVYYDNPILSLERFVKNAMACGERANDLINFQYDNFFNKRLMISNILEKKFGQIGKNGKLLVANHHSSHAASAFYPSPFEEAAILTIDGVGEWNTTTIGYGTNKDISIIEKIDYPHSLGMLYSAFTYFCGFKVNFGEYKLMGLAPYGEPIYYNMILKHLIDVKKDGSFRLNLKYFDFQYGCAMTNMEFEKLFCMKRRIAETEITKDYMNMAASIQLVTEKIILKLARHTAEILKGCKNLVMAGGIALNCTANGKLLREKIFDNVWIQPAAGDAGGAIGAAFLGYYSMVNERKIESHYNTYLGPSYDNKEIELFLKKNKAKYYKLGENREKIIAKLIDNNKTIGLFQGRMEFGPRALGNRSIIASAKDEKMQSEVNIKIKFRESFRPFAPAVIEADKKQYFDLNVESPYMLLCAPVQENIRCNFNITEEMKRYNYNMIAVSNIQKSEISAVTHVDFSARVQTVSEVYNEDFFEILKAYKEISKCSVIVNTSFNVRGEPIVCTPKDAYYCFMRTDMDCLVLNDYLLYKEEQPEFVEKEDWRSKYELD